MSILISCADALSARPGTSYAVTVLRFWYSWLELETEGVWVSLGARSQELHHGDRNAQQLAPAPLQDFGPDVIGVWLPTLDDLFAALAGGGESRLLGEIHVALLRVVQVLALLLLLPLPSEYSLTRAVSCSGFQQGYSQKACMLISSSVEAAVCADQQQHIALPIRQQGAPGLDSVSEIVPLTHATVTVFHAQTHTLDHNLRQP